MIDKNEVKNPKQRILSVCVRLFIEKGFKATTMLNIINEANVSAGTFQNIFRTKDGVLKELIDVMFEGQFKTAETAVKNASNPIFVYAAEVAIQLAIVELNENIREIYVEAYTSQDILEYLYQKTTVELIKIFKDYNPNWSDSDFYESEIGTAGMMRSFMMRKCDVYFTLKKKIERFLRMSLKCYNVPDEEIQKIIQYVNAMDMNKMANYVMERLFSTLEMTFGFKFEN